MKVDTDEYCKVNTNEYTLMSDDFPFLRIFKPLNLAGIIEKNFFFQSRKVTKMQLAATMLRFVNYNAMFVNKLKFNAR